MSAIRIGIEQMQNQNNISPHLRLLYEALLYYASLKRAQVLTSTLAHKHTKHGAERQGPVYTREIYQAMQFQAEESQMVIEAMFVCF